MTTDNDPTVQALVDQLSLDEKIALLSGKSMWTLHGNDRLNLPSIRLSDGPQGVRKTVDEHTAMEAFPATCFPTACALACSWNRSLLYRVGQALSQECQDLDVSVLLGPGLNIKRHPCGGRNFEYFSEDPVVSGHLAAAMIQGIQYNGRTAACAKHICVNNQESWRFRVNVLVDERTLRELYLRGFEYAIRQAQPATVMCAYNQLNGIYCSEHEWLFQDVVRGEWGFQGLVMTDWGACNQRIAGIKAGVDLEMPGTFGMHNRDIKQALKLGSLSQSKLDEAVYRNVKLIHTVAKQKEQEKESKSSSKDLYDRHHKLAYETALECIVLLQNDNQLLPLAAKTSVALIGDFCQTPRYQGMGSSKVTSTKMDTVLEHIGAHTDNYSFSRGYSADDDNDDSVIDPSSDDSEDVIHEDYRELIEQAVEAAQKAEVAVIFAGVPEIHESEGFDRQHIDLPLHHNQLIDRVCAVHDKVVVVLSNGGPVAMPWKNKVQAIVEGYLLGQAGARAMVEILFGVASPCGKLPETFPMSLQDVPSDSYFPGNCHTCEYREGLSVGYRYYDTAQVPVLFPFGHGLCYTEFEYSNASCQVVGKVDPDTNILAHVQFTITNTGTAPGKEIVQLYVHHGRAQATIYHPEHELREFAKTRLLQPEESEVMTIALTADAFSSFDVGVSNWILEEGARYELRLGASSRDIRWTGAIKGEDLAKAGCTVKTVRPTELATQSYPPLDRTACTRVSHPLVVTDASFAKMLGREPTELMELSTRSILLTSKFSGTNLADEEVALLPHHIAVIHRNSFLGEIERHSRLGKLFCSFVFREMRKHMEDNTCKKQQKMSKEISANLPLRSLAAFSSGALSLEMVDSLIALFNGEYCSASSQLGYVAYVVVASLFNRR